MSPLPSWQLQPLVELVDLHKDAWRAGQFPDARKVIEEHSELLQFRSLVVELAYEDYCVREERGEPPEPEQFCDQFPAYRTYIREVIRGHRLLADNPDLFQQTPRWPEKGEHFEGLHLIQELGRGAFARVYLAADPDTGNRPVVLKLSPARTAEAKTLGVIAHEHIVGVYWSRQSNDLHAVCMPYMGSTTLADAIVKVFALDRAHQCTAHVLCDTLTPAGIQPQVPGKRLLQGTEAYSDAVAIIAARIADALAYLHRRNIIHGDLKPSNILLGDGGHPYLIDFNLASHLEQRLPVVGGTLPYMAPERLQAMIGEKSLHVDGSKADIYALGVTLFEAWTGQVPLSPDPVFSPQASARDLLTRRLALTESDLVQRPEIPPSLRKLLGQCLARNPSLRPDLLFVQRELSRFGNRRRRWLAQSATACLTLASLAGVGLAIAPGPQVIREVQAQLREPTTAQEFLEQGIKRLRLGDAESSLRSLSRAMQLSPAGRTLALMGLAEGEMNRHTVAQKLYQEAVETYGCSEGWVHNNWAFHLLKFNQKQGHLEAYRQASIALEREPHLIPARINRATAAALLNMNGKGLAETNAEARLDLVYIRERAEPNAQLCYDLSICYLFLLEDPAEAQKRAIDSLCEARRLGMPVERIKSNPIFIKSNRSLDKCSQVFATQPVQSFEQSRDNHRIALPWD